jgi:predicted transcriptional regulator
VVGSKRERTAKDEHTARSTSPTRAHGRRAPHEARDGFQRAGGGCVVSTNGIPDDVVAFVMAEIDSIEQLEVLLALFRRAESSFAAEEIARELRIDAGSAAERLANLTARGLARETEARSGAYRYASPSSAIDRTVAGLATAYAERRVSVINLVFSKPIDKVQTFADAFRLRKDR